MHSLHLLEQALDLPWRSLLPSLRAPISPDGKVHQRPAAQTQEAPGGREQPVSCKRLSSGEADPFLSLFTGVRLRDIGWSRATPRRALASPDRWIYTSRTVLTD